MKYNFILVRIDSNYCDYLRSFDKRVMYNKDKKELRPFVGVIFKIGNIEYFAPLASPKLKHLTMRNNLDFLKINGGSLGVINFNNMIPVLKSNYTLIDLNTVPTNNKERTYYYLLMAQLSWLNAHSMQVIKKAKHLYNLYLTDKIYISLKNRCCNFSLLEEKCLEYHNLVKV